MLRMPTAVLMMIGQIEVMKITKIADGRLSRNAASEIGSQARGGTGGNPWKPGTSPRIPARSAGQGREQDPDDACETEADGDALQRGEDAPAKADILRPRHEERI